jgi:hypothetical protein
MPAALASAALSVDLDRPAPPRTLCSPASSNRLQTASTLKSPPAMLPSSASSSPVPFHRCAPPTSSPATTKSLPSAPLALNPNA